MTCQFATTPSVAARTKKTSVGTVYGDEPEYIGPCAGRLEWHHVIKQQRLRREFKYGVLPTPSWIMDATGQLWEPASRTSGCDRGLHFVLGDTRNRVFLCTHHHELVTNGRLTVVLPDSVWEFAREFGLEGMLENDLRKAA